MCQKSEGDSEYFSEADKMYRQCGYDAYVRGEPITSNPESDQDPEYNSKRQWDLGWKTASEGRAPW